MIITDSEQMFAYRATYFKSLLIGLLAVALLGVFGCGSGDEAETTSETRAAETTTEPAPEPASPDDAPANPDPDINDADPEAAKVIEEWSSALAEGDPEGAAKLFAIPSVAENGSILIPIESADDAIAFNETLPCGAILLRAKTAGEFINATFELTDRPGGDCGQGAGGTASTAFKIEDGKIVEWRRVPTAEESGSVPQGNQT